MCKPQEQRPLIPTDRVDHSRPAPSQGQALCPRLVAPERIEDPITGDGDARDHSRNSGKPVTGQVRFDADF